MKALTAARVCGGLEPEARRNFLVTAFALAPRACKSDSSWQMPHRNVYRHAAFMAACSVVLTFAATSRAQIPVSYKGKPFDPAVAGGPKCPPTVKAGPYAIPGRLDFVNYDLGGDGIAYHTGDHITKGGTGYRIDTPTATLSWTADCIPNGGPPTCTNVWYETSSALDGTPYPSATTSDFTIGAVQDGDWFNFTVNVAATGTYSLSSTWASGNGPPGGEGGNGDMGLEVLSNGTKLATWTAVFPNYNTEADFHHWVAYPNFATVTLTAGPQVIQLQSGAKHLQLDYVEFTLAGPDGGAEVASDAGDTDASADGSGTGASAGSGSGSTVSSGTFQGTTGTSSGAESSGTTIPSTGISGGSGAMSATAGSSSGIASNVSPTSGAGAPAASGSKGCAVSAASRIRSADGAWLLLGLGAVFLGRRRTADARRVAVTRPL